MVHIVLHFALCAAMSAAKPSATLPIHVIATDRGGTKDVDQTFTVERGYDDQKTVEFDMDQGVFRFLITARPKYDCSADQFVQVIPEQPRALDITLQSGTPGLGQPLLLSGKAPQSFLYAKPTFVLLRPDTACNSQIGTPLGGNIDMDNQQDGYYGSIESDPRAIPKALLAMKIRTAASQFHYVRLTIPYPVPWSGFANSIRFDVTEDMLDELAGSPVNTLLCPRLWKTSAG